MIQIDYQHGRHLRVGRFLVAVQADHFPRRFDVGTTVLNRLDTDKAAEVCRRAEVLVADAEHAPIAGEHDLVASRHVSALGEALTDWHLSHETERFGSYSVRVGERLWSFGCSSWVGLPPTWKRSSLRWRLRRYAERVGILDGTPRGVSYGGSDHDGEALEARR